MLVADDDGAGFCWVKSERQDSVYLQRFCMPIPIPIQINFLIFVSFQRQAMFNVENFNL